MIKSNPFHQNQTPSLFLSTEEQNPNFPSFKEEKKRKEEREGTLPQNPSTQVRNNINTSTKSSLPPPQNPSKRSKMMLGKRSRTSMKKTTSMTELLALDLTTEPKTETETVEVEEREKVADREGERLAEEPPPRSIQRRSSSVSDIPMPPHFLAACGLCQRKLGPGVDAFIYRGEVAFCSMECRHYMIREEEQTKKFETWMQTILKFNFQIPAISSPKGNSTLRS